MNTKLLLICFVFTMRAYGQSTSAVQDSAMHNDTDYKNHRFTIGGSIGAGAPIVEYGSPGSLNFSKQFAITAPGKYFDVNFNYLTSKHFGIMIEDNGTIKFLAKKFNESDYSLQTNGGTYYSGEAMFGPFYSFSFKNGNVFETRFLVGFTNFYQTPISGTEYYKSYEAGRYQPPSSFTIPAYKSFGACAELGLKFKFHVVKGFFITTNVSYTQLFAGGYYYNYTTFDEVPFFPPQPLALITASIGVEFEF